MKKIFLIIIFLSFSNNIVANSLEYKGLEKLSKNNTFMNDKGKPYSMNEISDKKNSLVIIYNHGSIQDVKQDPCKAKPQFGYIWDAAVVPAILKLHNKKISQIYKKFAKSLKINENFIVAVSGGPDSLALAFLSKIYSIQKNVKVKFYIIDHKLRAESTNEAKYVKKILNKFKIIKRNFGNI